MTQQFIVTTPGSGTTAPAAGTIINANFAELYGLYNQSFVQLSITNTAAQNTAALQAALNLGGTIYVLAPGVFPIDATLLIGDYTRIIVGKDTRLQLAAGANCALIRNVHAQNAMLASQVVVSGGTAVVTEPGHSRTVGSQVYIEGALGNTSLNGLQTITTVSGITWSFANAGTNPTNAHNYRIFISPAYQVAGANFVRASNVVTVTEAGHARQAGDHVYIAGLVGANSFNGPQEIVASTPGVSWTYANTGANETATGTANLLGDTGIDLVNFRYDGNKASNSADLFQAFTALFINVGNSSFDIDAINATWRALCPMNCGYLTIPRVRNENGAVCVQFDSFCNEVDVGILEAHNCTDDICAWGVTSDTGSTFGDTASPSGPGNMGVLRVRAIRGSSPTGMLKLFAYTGYDLGTVLVESITGSGIAINGDSTVGNAGGTLARAVVGELDVTPLAGTTIGIGFSGLSNYGDVTIKGAVDNYTSVPGVFFVNTNAPIARLRFEKFISETYPSATNSNYPPINLGPGTTIGDLTLSDSLFTAGNGGAGMQFGSGVTVGCVTFKNIEYSGNASPGSGNYNGNLLTALSGSVIGRIIVDGIRMTTGQAYSVLQLGGNAQTVQIDLTNVGDIGTPGYGACATFINDNGSSTSANVRFANMHFSQGPAYNVFELSGTGVWTLTGDGYDHSTVNPGGFALLTGGSPHVSINCPQAQIDIGSNGTAPPANLHPNAGDILWNTNATGTGLYGYTAAGAWTKVF